MSLIPEININEIYGHKYTTDQDGRAVHILTTTNTFTCYTELIPISNKQTITITKTLLDEWILRHGFYEQLKERSNQAGGLIPSNSNNKTKNPRPDDSNLKIKY